MTDRHTILHGDCREVMASMDADTFDSIVTDPPYGLSFMGKGWDHGVPGVEFWTEAMRVAKPGAHLLAFGGTRTYHRLACAIEDAGWEVRDCVMWVYGSGFPKSLDVGKAIDKAAGAEREVVGTKLGMPGYSEAPGTGSNCYGGGFGGNGDGVEECKVTAPATDLARQWHGWGTALKPAWEPIIVARKPLIGTVAANVTEWGTGAINVDGCRVGTERVQSGAGGWVPPGTGGDDPVYEAGTGRKYHNTGRWPANFIHDGSDEVVGLMPQTKSGVGDVSDRQRGSRDGWGMSGGSRLIGDSGSAARFFYSAKASKADRESDNHHPTVKPTALMAYLCRLVTQPYGLILDPFCGSGSTGKAAVSEGFRFVGIEREAEYVEIAERRVSAAVPADLFAEATP